jgi:hypothetical protein
MHEAPLGGFTYSVICKEEFNQAGSHYRSNTITPGSVDIELLKGLFNGTVPSLVERCSAIEGTAKRSPKCGMLKPFRVG